MEILIVLLVGPFICALIGVGIAIMIEWIASRMPTRAERRRAYLDRKAAVERAAKERF